MATFGYNPISDYLVIEVKCPECGEIMGYSIDVPSPDFSADTHRESCNYNEEEFVCENCGFEFSVDLCNGIFGGDGEIHGIEDEYLVGVHEHYPEDDDLDIPDDFLSEFIDPHVNEINETLSKLDVLDEPTRSLLYRNLFANVISCLEAYLSDTAISRIKNSPYYKRRFVENSEAFKKQSLPLSTIYSRMEQMDNLIMQRLKDIIYHNLDVVKPLYRDTFEIDLGDLSYLMKAIQKRHDIVHRNGKDKEGNRLSINKEDVKELIEKVSDFIQNIETQFRCIDFACEAQAVSEQELDSLFGANNKNDNNPK